MAVSLLQKRNQLVRSRTFNVGIHISISPQSKRIQTFTATTHCWCTDCSREGMRSTRGFTIFELLIVMALIAIFAAMGIPTLQESTRRNAVWTGSETIGTQIRQARLKAISRNKSFRVRFNCPAAGQFRILEVTGNGAIDNATDRCDLYQTHDSGVYVMPENVAYGTPPVLTVNSRGVFTSSGSIPATITVAYGSYSSRALTVSATGQINFASY